ncbi:hypothetical protein [Flavobacterium sp.]|jgi:hypothetical protein|uniref:hypothetical protein n=1 Tax=Flavobacterium sp. TaxID=239 RepID=UPI0037C121D3
MKKIFLFLLFVTHISFSQENSIKGYIVDAKNDTIKCTFIGISNMFNKKLLNPAAVCDKKITIQLENGDQYIYKPFALSSIHIYMSENAYNMPYLPQNTTGFQEIKFVGLKEDNYKYFYREIIVGKISVYHKYNQDMRANLTTKEIFVKDDEIKNVSSFSYRDDIGSIIIDYPELFKLWIDGNKNYKLHQSLQVIELYNEHFKNIQE